MVVPRTGDFRLMAFKKWVDTLHLGPEMVEGWIFEPNTFNFDRLHNCYVQNTGINNEAEMVRFLKNDVLHRGIQGANDGLKWWQDIYADRNIDKKIYLVKDMKEKGEKIWVRNEHGESREAEIDNVRRPSPWHGTDAEVWDKYVDDMRDWDTLIDMKIKDVRMMRVHCNELFHTKGDKEEDLAEKYGYTGNYRQSGGKHITNGEDALKAFSALNLGKLKEIMEISSRSSLGLLAPLHPKC